MNNNALKKHQKIITKTQQPSLGLNIFFSKFKYMTSSYKTHIENANKEIFSFSYKESKEDDCVAFKYFVKLFSFSCQ
jgi:hypothetical protein